MFQELLWIGIRSEGLCEAAEGMEHLTFHYLIAQDEQYLGPGAASQGPGTDDLRWERTWWMMRLCSGMDAKALILSVKES